MNFPACAACQLVPQAATLIFLAALNSASDRIAPFAGIIDFDGDPRQALDHELPRLRRVPTGSAGGNVDFLSGFKFGFRSDSAIRWHNRLRRGPAPGARS